MIRFSIMSVIAICTSLTIASSGCSALFVNGPPADYQTRSDFTCTQGKGWIYFDSLQAAGNAFWGLYYAVSPPTDEYGNELDGDAQGILVGTSVLFALLHAGAAYSGNKKVNKCRAAIAERDSPPPPRPPPAPGAPAVRADLTRADVIEGMTPVQDDVAQCGAAHGVGGVVKVRVAIQPDGSVSSVATEQGDEAFADCVEAALHKARFPAARTGRPVTYPFTLPPQSTSVDPPVEEHAAAPSVDR